jgi:hypothetical protein
MNHTYVSSEDNQRLLAAMFNISDDADPAQLFLAEHHVAARLAVDDKARACLHAIHEAGEQPFTPAQVNYLQTVGHAGAVERFFGVSPLAFVAAALETNPQDFSPVQLQWARHFASEQACGTDNASLYELLASQD